jgi:hypothetical protein
MAAGDGYVGVGVDELYTTIINQILHLYAVCFHENGPWVHRNLLAAVEELGCGGWQHVGGNINCMGMSFADECQMLQRLLNRLDGASTKARDGRDRACPLLAGAPTAAVSPARLPWVTRTSRLFLDGCRRCHPALVVLCRYSSTRTIPVAPVVLDTIRDYIAEFGHHESGLDRSRAIIQEALGDVVHSTSTVKPLWSRFRRSEAWNGGAGL